MNRRTILYIATSIDGYIAAPDDNLDFLRIVEADAEDYGYHDFLAGIDTVIIGRRTFDWVVDKVNEFPHKDKQTFVVTRTPKIPDGSVQFYTGDLNALLTSLKQEHGKNIFVDGGAMLVNSLLDEDLIDEMILSIVPVLIGNGTRLFRDGRPEQRFHLSESESFDSGLIQLRYLRDRTIN